MRKIGGNELNYLHIDRSKATVGDGTADGTGEGESRVESETAELARSSGSGLAGEGIGLLDGCRHDDWLVRD